MAPLLFSLLLSLFLFVSSVSCHNWLHTASRAFQASTVQPCLNRMNVMPHIQAAPGQIFQMEWSTGHGDFSSRQFYFVALHADDEHKLDKITEAVIEDYIYSAPPSARLNGTFWQRRHVSNNGTIPAAMLPIYFDGPPLLNTSDLFIPRDPIMAIKSKTSMIGANTLVNQWKYQDSMLAEDIRVEYFNPRYPWIESASMFFNGFQNNKPHATEVDLANFRIPGRRGGGDYIYFFHWGGYYDCVDVNLWTGGVNVTNRYGVYNGSAVDFFPVDHCEVQGLDVTRYSPWTKCKIVKNNDVQPCISDCKKDSRCTMVHSIRFDNPPGTLPYAPNIPFSYNDYASGVPASPGCGSSYANVRLTQNCTSVFPNCDPAVLKPQPGDYICYGFKPYVNPALQATSFFQIARTPDDPRYYSTCWFRMDSDGYLNISVIARETPPWRAGDRCVDCKFLKNITNNRYYVPDWSKGLTKKCVGCDEYEQF